MAGGHRLFDEGDRLLPTPGTRSFGLEAGAMNQHPREQQPASDASWRLGREEVRHLVWGKASQRGEVEAEQASGFCVEGGLLFCIRPTAVQPPREESGEAIDLAQQDVVFHHWGSPRRVARAKGEGSEAPFSRVRTGRHP